MKKYVFSGGTFGNAMSYLHMGKCVGFDSFFKDWQNWEKEYSKRGYRTISLDSFIELGGYGLDISSQFLVKRDKGETPILYSSQIENEILGVEILPDPKIENLFRKLD